MMKKLLMLAGTTLLLATAISADWPFPPCFPDACSAISSTR